MAARPIAVTVVVWICQILAAVQFFLAGSAKLTGAPMMIGVFDAVGVGQWLRFVTGAIEVIGAVLLLIPAVAAIGAALLAMTMVGAIIAHFTVIPVPPTMPVILLIMVGIVFWVRRPRIFRAITT